MVLFFAGKDSNDVLMNGALGMQRDGLEWQKEGYTVSDVVKRSTNNTAGFRVVNYSYFKPNRAFYNFGFQSV